MNLNTRDAEIHETLWSDGGITIHPDGTFTGAGVGPDLTLDSHGILHAPDGYVFIGDDPFGFWTTPEDAGTYYIAHCPDDETVCALLRKE